MAEANQNRDHMIKVRVTADELAAIKDRCSNRELAPWLRSLALDQDRPRTAQPPPADPALIYQLSGLGNLLNQVTRRINSRLRHWPADERMKVLGDLRRVRYWVEKIAADHGYDMSG